MKILFAASEAYPLIKTGGLGDVMHSLPQALSELGNDVSMVLPAYRNVLDQIGDIEELGFCDIRGASVTHRARVLQAKAEHLGDYLYLIDVPALYDREGNPYVSPDGEGWGDNAERFTVFSRAVAEIAKGIPGKNWIPDIVHSNDWQTGLVSAFLSTASPRPKTVFTIHNLAYDGYFSHGDFYSLALPPEWWSAEYLEFYGGFSMMKAGLIFADHVTTVSPTYAEEIKTPGFGNRYEGLLNHIDDRLSGILNGIDLEVWDPSTDTHIAANYDVDSDWKLAKQNNKKTLLELAGFSQTKTPLIGFVGRLVEQKGLDLIIGMLPELLKSTNSRLIFLGTGNKKIEKQLDELAKQHPKRIYLHIGYSEDMAHKIEAGSDIFLMPSRFEPCGLNQMYSLRYGTPPVVNYTGGLADTVVDSTPQSMTDKTANGFVFRETTAEALLSAILRALDLYKKPKQWTQICETGMRQDLGWENSAKQYQMLYNS